MLDKYSYKQKFTALVVLAVLMIALAYKRSFGTAIASGSAYFSDKAKLENSALIQSQRQALLQRNADLDAQIGHQQMDAVLVQNALVDFMATQPGSTELTTVAPMHTYSDDYFTRHSNNIIINGSFNELIRTIYAYESEFSLSQIRHISMYRKKNFKTRKHELFTALLFQHYQQH
ncbi:hypothetical protein [Gilvibacter sp.]|uniref:hypothetical protein n=1 Tax=Gilvibacter sp. TaxID=2729997 RepID=UPI003F49CF9F